LSIEQTTDGWIDHTFFQSRDDHFSDGSQSNLVHVTTSNNV